MGTDLKQVHCTVHDKVSLKNAISNGCEIILHYFFFPLNRKVISKGGLYALHFFPLQQKRDKLLFNNTFRAPQRSSDSPFLPPRRPPRQSDWAQRYFALQQHSQRNWIRPELYSGVHSSFRTVYNRQVFLGGSPRKCHHYPSVNLSLGAIHSCRGLFCSKKVRQLHTT